jgi:polar amino acid transport system substrate-binding protein
MPWARGYFYLELHPNVVLFATAKSKEREKLFKWACPITVNKYVLIAKKDRNITINTLDEIKNYKIGTILSDIVEQLLLNQGIPQKNILGVPNILQNLQKLVKDRIDLIGFGEYSAKKAMQEHGFNLEKFETVFCYK